MRILIGVASLCLIACGAKPQPASVPTLPGDGDVRVAPREGTAARPDDPWAGRTDLIAAPAATPPAKAALAPVTEFKLGNGLQVFLIKSDRLPVVSFQIAIRAGRAQEPRARLGVAEATGDMLVKGTKRRDAVGLAKAIDFVGGTMSVNTTFEATLVSCRVLARDRATCLRLLPEVLTQSTFPDDELQKVKDEMVANVRQRLDSAATLASAHAQNLLWGDDHVRGWINSEQSVAAIARDDLAAWSKAWFVPNNAMLVVTGDFEPKTMKRAVEQSFAAWKKTAVPPAPRYNEPKRAGVRIRLVDKPGQTQTHIRVAQLGIRHDDPRFFDTLVWNYALGGGAFSSRLMQVVRVEGGKVYSASSSFDSNRDRGSFVAQTFTRNAEAVATTKLLISQIAKMAKDGPSQAEVSSAIANIAGGYALRFQSASEFGAALLSAQLHGFGTEYLANFPLAVSKVDVASARLAAKEILDPKNYVIVMVGDAKDLEPQLRREGWKYDKVGFAEPISAHVPSAAPSADPAAVAAARRIIAEALAAKGGQAKLAKVKSVRIVAAGTTSVQGKSLPVRIERVYAAPDKMRIDATVGEQNNVVIALDGKTGWQIAPDRKTGQRALVDLGGPEMAAALFEAWRDPEFILLKASDPAATLAPQPDQKVNGRDMSVVTLASPFGSLEVGIYVDKATKLVARIAYRDQGQTETDDFSDYRDAGGLKVAHKRVSSSRGQMTTLVVSKVEIDGPVDAKLFGKPDKL